MHAVSVVCSVAVFALPAVSITMRVEEDAATSLILDITGYTFDIAKLLRCSPAAAACAIACMGFIVATAAAVIS